MLAQGHSPPGNLLARLDLAEAGWLLELTRLDGDPDLAFAALHGRAVGPGELLQLVPGLATAEWRSLPALPGLPGSCLTELERYRVQLAWHRAGPAPGELPAALAAFLSQGRGRRLL